MVRSASWTGSDTELIPSLILLALPGRQCVKKGTLCEFVKSRRGGARKKKLEIGEQTQPTSSTTRGTAN